MKLLDKLFGTYSERELKRIQPLVDKVLNLESVYSSMSDDCLKSQTSLLKTRLSHGESLDDILPDSFAIMRESSWRVLGMKHFPVQIQGGIILHQGRIAEMRTGEGKSNPVNTPVPTPVGWKVVGDIQVGDYLFDMLGKPTQVLGVYPQGVIDTYNVTLLDGREVKCGKDHLWYVYTCDSCTPTVLTTESMYNQGCLCSSGYTFSLPVSSPVDYSLKSYAIEPYTYGCSLGSFCHPSDSVLTSLTPNVSLDTSILSSYTLGSLEQRWSFIQGLMDSAGIVSLNSTNTLSIICSSSSLMSSIMEIIYSLGCSCSFKPFNRSSFEIFIDVPNSLKPNFFRLSPYKSALLCSSSVESSTDYSRICITNISKLDEQTSQVCFEVDNSLHLFLIGSYVTTHNTLVSTLPVYLNALTGKGAYVVTVNDYLAKRDSLWMGKVYSFLGLSVGLISHDLSPSERKLAYNCDIVYSTNNELGFDYLRDNMAYSLDSRVQRPYNFAIIDEVDSVLIDEARTPLIISGFSGKSDDGYRKADIFVKGLRCKTIVELESGSKLEQATAQLRGIERLEAYSDYDYIVEEKKKSVSLTSQGVSKAELFYGISNLSDSDNMEINHYITRSLKAHGLFKLDVDYVLKDNKVVIVDESTGRLMDGRRYSEGVHQALEAKENVDVQQESKTLASITFQNLFRKFPKLSGMTGTAQTESEEFQGIYNLDIVEIPTNKPISRVDKPDRVYITRKAKLDAIVSRVQKQHSLGQPILIGTTSVEKSEELSSLFHLHSIPHTVLNAKYHEQEAQIIAQAGHYGSVTIATNMAGRGTDIILGGNPEYQALEELRSEGFSDFLLNEATNLSHTDDSSILEVRNLFKLKESRIKKELGPIIEQVKSVGGLYIIGSERHESRRIDNQLRGRSGRQGDVGMSEFMLSLEDDLMRIFGSNTLVDLCSSLKIPSNLPIDMGILSNNIEKAQKRIEGNNYAARKSVLEYDEVFSKQRDLMYSQRLRLLSSDIVYKDVVRTIITDLLDSIFESCVSNPKRLSLEDISSLNTSFEFISKYNISLPSYSEDSLYDLDFSTLKENFKVEIFTRLDSLWSTVSVDFLNTFSKKLLLFLSDNAWQEHMVNIEELKKGIGLRAYSQIDPLQAYKFESFDLFDGMITGIKEDVLSTFLGLYDTHILDSNSSLPST